jgi:hypothetical protein
MKSVDYIYYLFFASVALLVILIILIRRSPLEKNTKIVLYILSVRSPFMGLIVSLIFHFKSKKQVRP